jgi:amino acid transporter
MGSVVLLLAILGFMVLFAYLKFPPPYANKKMVSTFDMMVLAVCTLLCVSWIFYMRGALINTTAERLWQPLAVVGALGIEIVFLGLCFVLRNFWVFKPPRRPGRDSFFDF